MSQTLTSRFLLSKFILFLNARQAFSFSEFWSLTAAGIYFLMRRIDPLYQGIFEKKYTARVSQLMGGGYADAVNSGTNACYICIKSLELKKNSKIGVSSFTDPGVFNAVYMAGFEPVPLPFVSDKDHQIDIKKLEEYVCSNSLKAIIVVHTFGVSERIEQICKICQTLGVKIIEDISQAQGASLSGKMLGTFGEVSFFSTMGRKSVISGSSGGVIFTQNKELARKIFSISDRGKYVSEDFQVSNDARKNIDISLNFSSDEFLCAIGKSSIDRLESCRNRRNKLLKKLDDVLSKSKLGKHLQVMKYDAENSPFVAVIQITSEELLQEKQKFAELAVNSGAPINPTYLQIAGMWPWLETSSTEQSFMAEEWSKRHIILYLHEGYKDWYIKLIARALLQAYENTLEKRN